VERVEKMMVRCRWKPDMNRAGGEVAHDVHRVDRKRREASALLRFRGLLGNRLWVIWWLVLVQATSATIDCNRQQERSMRMRRGDKVCLG